MAAGPEEIINEDGAHAVIFRKWLSEDYAQDLHERLTKELDWGYYTAQIYGKKFNIPRGMFFLGDQHVKSYSYSKTIKGKPVLPWDDFTLYKEIESIRTKIIKDERLYSFINVPLVFDSCLINQYRDGQDKIDPHSDKEAMGVLNAVVTVSLGESRKFVFKSKTRDENGKFRSIHTKLNNGDLVFMFGECQNKFTHAIPREPKIQKSRISLTYRLIKP
jgi:alkylated DNA repair dioxygenase AlkB